jgi:hypothetical protein
MQPQVSLDTATSTTQTARSRREVRCSAFKGCGQNVQQPPAHGCVYTLWKYCAVEKVQQGLGVGTRGQKPRAAKAKPSDR